MRSLSSAFRRRVSGWGWSMSLCAVVWTAGVALPSQAQLTYDSFTFPGVSGLGSGARVDDMTVGSYGSIYLLGTVWGPTDLDGDGRPDVGAPDGPRAVAARYTSDFRLLWSRQLLTSHSTGQKLALHESHGPSFDYLWVTVSSRTDWPSADFSRNLHVLKLDDEGSVHRFTSFRPLEESSIFFGEIDLNSNGEPAIIGAFRGQVDFGPGPASGVLETGPRADHESSRVSDGFVAWLDTSANLVDLARTSGHHHTGFFGGTWVTTRSGHEDLVVASTSAASRLDVGNGHAIPVPFGFVSYRRTAGAYRPHWTAPGLGTVEGMVWDGPDEIFVASKYAGSARLTSVSPETGRTLWGRDFGAETLLLAVEASVSGEPIVSLRLDGAVDLDSDGVSDHRSAGVDTVVVAMDRFGGVEWSRQITGVNSEALNSLAIGPGGLVHAAGAFGSPEVDIFANGVVDHSVAPRADGAQPSVGLVVRFERFFRLVYPLTSQELLAVYANGPILALQVETLGELTIGDMGASEPNSPDEAEPSWGETLARLEIGCETDLPEGLESPGFEWLEQPERRCFEFLPVVSGSMFATLLELEAPAGGAAAILRVRVLDAQGSWWEELLFFDGSE